jgi:hypothetical protein
VSKKIILCADGTWNTPHGPAAQPNDTNVRKLYELLLDDPSQLRYYDSGVGTDGTPFEHFFGGSMGAGLFQKIQDGYAFLSYVWGLPKHRTVPANAVLSNTVKSRMDRDPTYKPENLLNGSADSYTIATVISDSEL